MIYRQKTFLLIFLLIIIGPSCYSNDFPVNISELDLHENTVSFKHNWKFHPYQFLDQTQVDTAYWETVKLPHRWDWASWKGEPMAEKGIATYWLRIIMPDIDFPIGLKFYESLSANKIFLNNKLLVETGKVSSNKDEEIPDYTNEISFIPMEFKKGDTLDIIIHHSNWHFTFGSLRKTVVIGDLQTMEALKTKRVAMDSLLLGAVALIGFSQLIFFYFRRKSKHFLYLFLISVAIFFRLASVDEMLLRILFPGMPFNLLVTIRWVTTYLSIPVTMQYIYVFFPGLLNKNVLKFSWAISLIHTFITIFFPFTLKIYYAYHVHFLMILGALYVIYICIKAIKYKYYGGKTLTIGIAVTFFFMVNDILYSQQLSPFANFIGWGVLAFFLALLIVTSKSFSNVLKNEEKLTSELSELNKNLEEKVVERTQVIETQNHVLEDQHKHMKNFLKDQETLMAVVAHDLKAPLNRAAGLAEAMSISGELSKDQLMLNKKIIEVAKAGSKLIEQLTTLQKYEHKKAGLPIKKLKISEILEDLFSDYTNLATEKKIQYNYHLEENIVGKSNKEGITRVFDNLISNAIKFSPTFGSVYVNAQNKDNLLTVTVEDSGPGFKETDRQKLFGKFQRLSAQPTAGENSTGLGLSIVKMMVDKLRGTIELISEPGKGAKFLVKIPLN